MPPPGHPGAPLTVVTTGLKVVVSYMVRAYSEDHIEFLSMADSGIEASMAARVVHTLLTCLQ